MISSRVALAIAAGLGLGPLATAQFSNVAGSGCPGSGFVGHNGSPRLGTSPIVAWSCRNQTELPILVLGLLAPPTPLPAALVCGTGPCVAVVQPIVALTGTPGQVVVTNLVLPNDPGFVGTCIGAQGLCPVNPPGCLTASVGLSICIQP